jgi:O-antigen/teichoic acid export membrane protein
VQTASCSALLRFSLPRHPHAARFQRRLLLGIWRFAASLMGIGLVSVIVMQLDSIVLIKIIPLRDYGYYSLAKVVAGGLTMMIGPIFDAMFPLFSRLVAIETEAENGDRRELSRAYHRACQLMSAMLLPTVLVLILFAREVVLVWTGKPEYALHLRLLVGLLALGTGLNGLMNLPYALQLAYGWTRLHLNATLVAVSIQIPLLIFMATHYGAAGAAVVWILFNGGFVFIVLNLMHRRLLPGEQGRWYLEDVGMPLLAALTVVGAARMLPLLPLPRLALAAGIGVVWGAALVAAALAAPQLRALLRRRFTARQAPIGALE